MKKFLSLFVVIFMLATPAGAAVKHKHWTAHGTVVSVVKSVAKGTAHGFMVIVKHI